MANDRLYLRCRKCQDIFYLCKYYPSTGLYNESDKPEDYISRFDEFLEKHNYCYDHSTFLYPSPFECVSESEHYGVTEAQRINSDLSDAFYGYWLNLLKRIHKKE